MAPVSLCMCVGVYVCVYVCMYVCICACECMYVYMCVCMYVCMYVCVYVCVYVCMYMCVVWCVMRWASPICAVNMSSKAVDSRRTLQSKFKPPMRPSCSMIAWGGEEGRHDAGVGRREGMMQGWGGGKA